MPLPWLIPAGIQAGSSLAGYFARPKRKPFGETPYGQYLARIASEGMYSSEVRRGLLGEVSRRTGTQAQQSRARIRGGLVSRGMGKSIAGERLLATPGRERMRSLATATERIERENLLSKRRAGERLGMEGTQWEEKGRLEETQARGGLLGGLGQAGLGAYQGYRTESALGDLAKFGGEEGKPGPYAPLVLAHRAGVQIPYSGMKAMFEKEELPFELPDNFLDMKESELFEFSVYKKLNFDFLEYIQNKLLMEQLRKPMGIERYSPESYQMNPSINRGLWSF